jgi:hypothetical protein
MIVLQHTNCVSRKVVERNFKSVLIISLTQPHLVILLGPGDPVQSEEIIVGKLAMDKLEQASGHQQKTRDALYPVEVKKLWEVLRANGFSADVFMRYTMFIQAITLGNRACGMLGTTIAHASTTIWSMVVIMLSTVFNL